ncbi:MAG: hypothetical protein HMLKMBBP_02038 [Planctomycetes bacterium]|nr:hypothetical protein [Planctomycetota bacterium]
MPPIDVAPAWIAPFAILLLCIAVLPLAAGHWWEHNKNKGIIAAVLSAPVLWWVFRTDGHLLQHAGMEYIAFIALLGSLFVISGGIFVDGDLRATPKVNAAFLAIGAVIASFIGTTGASMLLIRPLLRTNSQRKHVVHTVVFFIFIVSNCGGLLTPLGDPPLFLGYLRGVPFDWTLHLVPEWAGVNIALLLIYFVWDSLAVKKETREALRLDLTEFRPIRVEGGANLVLLLGVVATVAFGTTVTFKDANPHMLDWARIVIMAVLTVASLAITSKDVRTKNSFSWGPIVEVAVLFAGIFVTMIPALKYLELHGKDLPIDGQRGFFWVTGALSSFLDNAPTYLTFCSVAAAKINAVTPGLVNTDNLETLIKAPGGEDLLIAISVGAVFMGANTYIGNGPNFMVKAIADSSGVKMPSFFGYMLYSVAILIPLFVGITFIIFHS